MIKKIRTSIFRDLAGYLLVTFLLALTLNACRSVTIVQLPEIPAATLPDLVVSNVYLGMQGVPGGWGNCVTAYSAYEIRGIIQNLGQAPAYNIPVVETSTGTNLVIGELGPGQSTELYFPATSPSGTYSVSVDSQNTIPESNKNNNNYAYLAITPTPPALCPSTVPPLATTKATALSFSTLGAVPATEIPSTQPATPNTVQTQPSAQIIYYFFVKDNTFPAGSIKVFPSNNDVLVAPTQSDITRSPDIVANIRSALQSMIDDTRNLYLCSDLVISTVTFNEGHAEVILQGRVLAVHTLDIAVRMQILLTVFAESPVQTAVITFNGDTIGNMGISDSRHAKPADYIFTRAEIETFMAENAYKPIP
jgi:hypothetical protein